MPFASGSEHRDEGSVLVVYANFGVAAGVALRLMDSGAVVLARPSWALTALSGPAPCDVVLLCPYLKHAERRAVLRAAASRPRPPAVLELADVVGDPVTVRTLDAGAARGATGEPFVHSVITALAAPTS